MTFFDQICGDWRLERDLDDRRAGVIARFEGVLSMVPEPGGIIATETGAWVDAPWGPLSGRRRDLWGMDGAEVVVRFDHGGEFHRFVPRQTGAADVRHPCGRDLYLGRYEFDLPASWRVTWDVRGPAKEYRTVTRFRKMSDGPAHGAQAAG